MKVPKSLIWLNLLVVAFLVNGCSGISTSQSVSPATFLLPGLLHVPSVETNEVAALEAGVGRIAYADKK